MEKYKKYNNLVRTVKASKEINYLINFLGNIIKLKYWRFQRLWNLDPMLKNVYMKVFSIGITLIEPNTPRFDLPKQKILGGVRARIF